MANKGKLALEFRALNEGLDLLKVPLVLVVSSRRAANDPEMNLWNLFL
jgi:hypothetical protein